MATKNAINSNIPIEVSKGGTGNATLTDHGVLVGSATGAITPLAVGSTGELFIGTSASDPAFGTSATGDFTFGGSAAGAARTLTIANTSNTASSEAIVDITVGGTSAADPYISYAVTGETDWSHGIDNDDDDKFKLSANAAPGTADVLVAATTGEVIMPLQPAFGATATTQNDVTGDGTAYTITWTGSEYFDQNDDFDGTSTFTAPVSGIFQFNLDVHIKNLTSSHTSASLTISTTSRDYESAFINPYAARNAGNACGVHFSILVDMAATDTAVAKVTVSGGGKTIDLVTNCYFNGYLAC